MSPPHTASRRAAVPAVPGAADAGSVRAGDVSSLAGIPVALAADVRGAASAYAVNASELANAALGELRRETTTTTTTTATTTTTEAPRDVPRQSPPPPPATTVPAPPRHGEVGQASWYGAPAGTCASPTLAFGTELTVMDLATGASVTCRVSDREASNPGRVVDLSGSTFPQLAPLSVGIIEVRLTW